jgi:hypothetical protein
MPDAIELLYGEHVLEDLEFCRQNADIIERYSHAIMTSQGGVPRKTLEAIAVDPASAFGWTHSVKGQPGDYEVLTEFLNRVIRQYCDSPPWHTATRSIYGSE